VSALLTVNAGSTSLKLVTVADDDTVVRHRDLAEAVAGPTPSAVVHRVVHGGHRDRAALVDDALVAELEALTELAPLQQPPALQAIRACRAQWPEVPHIACFDTAFHRTIPPAASTYALPAHLRERLRVFGFHGLSHAWASARARDQLPGARRVVVAHLGGGASLCAVLDGASIDTTMGFTPLDGLVMATRSGHLDPGAVLWLVEHSGEDVADLLARRSGLLGLAGTDDLREVLRRRAAGDAESALAFEVYLHRLVTYVAMMAGALQGIDVLVLTGGAGEHSPELHDELSAKLAWLGAATIVLPAREDLQMAAEARALLG
jgi:acetate kinase